MIDNDHEYRGLGAKVVPFRYPNRGNATAVDVRNSCATMAEFDSGWDATLRLSYGVDVNIYDVHIEVFLVPNFCGQKMQ